MRNKIFHLKAKHKNSKNGFIDTYILAKNLREAFFLVVDFNHGSQIKEVK